MTVEPKNKNKMADVFLFFPSLCYKKFTFYSYFNPTNYHKSQKEKVSTYFSKQLNSQSRSILNNVHLHSTQSLGQMSRCSSPVICTMSSTSLSKKRIMSDLAKSHNLLVFYGAIIGYLWAKMTKRKQKVKLQIPEKLYWKIANTSSYWFINTSSSLMLFPTFIFNALSHSYAIQKSLTCANRTTSTLRQTLHVFTIKGMSTRDARW